jgi:hypothetical protein
MITINDEASFEAALNASNDPTLRGLLAARLKLYRAGCLLDLTTLAVIEAGDTADDVERETGLNPLVNPIDGARHPSPNFHAYWDYFERDSYGWNEWISCSGDTGYATILLIPDRPGIDPELLSLCRTYADAGRGEQP